MCEREFFFLNYFQFYLSRKTLVIKTNAFTIIINLNSFFTNPNLFIDSEVEKYLNKQFTDSHIFFLLLFFCWWFVFDFCFLFFFFISSSTSQCLPLFFLFSLSLRVGMFLFFLFSSYFLGALCFLWSSPWKPSHVTISWRYVPFFGTKSLDFV